MDLWVYQQVNSGCPQNQVMCDALELFIRERLRNNTELKERFEEARVKHARPPAGVVKLVDGPARQAVVSERQRRR